MFVPDTDIRRKELAAVKAELKIELQENCRVELDNLVDCQTQVGPLFQLWRCRIPQHELWQCEKKYEDKAYRRKREIEILETRQQQGDYIRNLNKWVGE